MSKSFKSLRTYAKIKYFYTSEYVKCETKTLASKFPISHIMKTENYKNKKRKNKNSAFLWSR